MTFLPPRRWITRSVSLGNEPETKSLHLLDAHRGLGSPSQHPPSTVPHPERRASEARGQARNDPKWAKMQPIASDEDFQHLANTAKVAKRHGSGGTVPW